MVRFSVFRSALLTVWVGVGTTSTAVRAATFASGVADYEPGSYSGLYDESASATGSPDALTGESFGYDNILSPFSPAYEREEIVGIGTGGHLTLSFAKPVLVTGAPEIGVFTNVGLVDADYDTLAGQNTDPASTFSGLRAANVSISVDGQEWVKLGPIDFDLPTNYFSNASNPFQSAPPASPQVADFSKPFVPTVGPSDPLLSAFDGLTWAETLQLLDGSGGGNWIDVPVGTLDAFSYVRFDIPGEGYVDTDGQLFIDAVSVAASSVPEPTGLALLGIGAGSLLVRRRKGE